MLRLCTVFVVFFAMMSSSMVLADLPDHISTVSALGDATAVLSAADEIVSTLDDEPTSGLFRLKESVVLPFTLAVRHVELRCRWLHR